MSRMEEMNTKDDGLCRSKEDGTHLKYTSDPANDSENHMKAGSHCISLGCRWSQGTESSTHSLNYSIANHVDNNSSKPRHLCEVPRAARRIVALTTAKTVTKEGRNGMSLIGGVN